MSRLLLICLPLLFTFSASIGQGISFIEEGWEDVLAQAKKEDKLIFLDAYTTWCGPCKYMSKNIFPDEKVASFFNENFINAKFDMEKGEGLELANQYDVQAYPTLFFINSEGEVAHMALGGHNAEQFLELGAAALDPNRQWKSLNDKYESGDKSDATLKNLAMVLRAANDDSYDKIASEYLKDKDWTTEENILFIFDYSQPSNESELFRYSIENKDAFAKVVGLDKIDMKLAYAAEHDAYLKEIDNKDLNALTAHFLDYFPSKTAQNKARELYLKTLMYSPDPKDQETFKKEAQLLLASEPDLGSDFYNSVAWEYHTLTDDPYLLALALKWVDISIAEEENFYNSDTKASILQKLGNKADALTWAEKAVMLGKAEGSDTGDTEALIERIKAMK